MAIFGSLTLSFGVFLVILGSIYCAPSTNVVDQINTFLKSDVLYRSLSLCDNTLAISELSLNVYQVATFEIERNSNTSAKLCISILDFTDVDHYKVEKMMCYGGKRFNLPSSEALPYQFTTQLIAEYYPKSCLVEDMSKQRNSSIWLQVFGNQDGPMNNSEYAFMEFNAKSDVAPGASELQYNTYSYDKLSDSLTAIKLTKNGFIEVLTNGIRFNEFNGLKRVEVRVNGILETNVAVYTGTHQLTYYISE